MLPTERKKNNSNRENVRVIREKEKFGQYLICCFVFHLSSSASYKLPSSTMGKETPDNTARYTLGIYRVPFISDAVDAKVNDDSAAFDHVETTSSISSGKIQRPRMQMFRHHWKRFWCCYSFFAMIFLAIFLPILYIRTELFQLLNPGANEIDSFVICIPTIAQMIVNHSTL